MEPALGIKGEEMPKHVSRSCCHNAPTALAVALLECVAAVGGGAEAILRGTGVNLGALREGDGELSIKCFTHINRACNIALRDHLERTGCGSSLNEQQFRLLCRCLVGSADLEEALRTTIHFFAMFDGRLGTVELEVASRQAILRFNPVRHYRSEASFLVDVYGIAVMHMLNEWLTGQLLRLDQVQLAYPRSDLGVISLGLFDCPVQFGQQANGLWFDAGVLRRPVVRTQADLMALLRSFPFDLMLTGQDRKPLAEQIYIAMMNAHVRTRRMPTVDQVAKLFGVSSWTLRRRLTEEGTAYSKIRRTCQLNLATEFLRRSELTIDEVADIANFSDASAFRRAFQQWTGRSPSAYRETLLAG